MRMNRHLLRQGALERVITVCVSQNGDQRDPFVLFCADGQSTPTIANAFFKAAAGQLSVCFVGIDSCPQHRNGEYVDGRDPERFALHEALWTDTAVKWVEQTLERSLSPRRTGVFGFSCGGSFAASVGLRHPDLFGNVFAFSIAGRPVSDFSQTTVGDITQSSFYLTAGSREPKGMRNYMKRFHTWLKKNGATSNFCIGTGGHELSLWSAQLNAVLIHAAATSVE